MSQTIFLIIKYLSLISIMTLQTFKKNKSLSLIYKYRIIIIHDDLIENVLKIKLLFFSYCECY